MGQPKTLDQLPQITQITDLDRFIMFNPEGEPGSQTMTAQAQFLAQYIGQAVIDLGTLQPGNDNLTAISGLTGTGFSARTSGSSTWSLRSLTAPAAGLTIANSDGAAGNPTFALANDLSAIEALASTGLAVRSAADTWVQRQLTAPAAGITVTNPAGIAGDITLVLANDLAGLEALATSGIPVRTGTDTWVIRSLAAPAAGLAITNPAGTAGNFTFALANDLSAVEALSGSGIARRTGTDTWSVGTTVATAEITDDAVTYAKIQDVTATDRVLGRSTAGAGNIEEITFTSFMRSLADDTTSLAARSTLGVSIGSDVQGYSALLAAIAAVTPTKGRLLVANGTTWQPLAVGSDTYVLTADSAQTLGILWAAPSGGGGGAPTTSQYVTLATDAGLANERVLTAGTGIGVTDGGAGTTVTIAISDAELLAIAGLTSAADKAPYFTGSGTASLFDLTTVARTLLAQTSQANMRTTGLGLGSLATLSSINDGNWSGTDLAVANGGTGVSTLTNHGVVLGQGSSALATTSAGTLGQVLTSNGASADPTFQTPASGASYSQVATSGAITGGTANVSFTSIASEDLIVVMDGIVTSSTASLQMEISIDNGSNWSTPQAITSSFWTTAARYGTFNISGVKSGHLQMFGAPPSSSAFGINNFTQAATFGQMFNPFFWRVGSQVNAIRFSFTGGETFASGLIKLLGR